nr:MAG TPA: Transcriptional regulatory protein RcsB factor, DNA BINDING PROTEIN.6A [Bacteriophage sp.]
MLREAGFSLRAIAAKMDMPVRTVRGYISQRTRNCSVADFRVRKK